MGLKRIKSKEEFLDLASHLTEPKIEYIIKDEYIEIYLSGFDECVKIEVVVIPQGNMLLTDYNHLVAETFIQYSRWLSKYIRDGDTSEEPTRIDLITQDITNETLKAYRDIGKSKIGMGKSRQLFKQLKILIQKDPTDISGYQSVSFGTICVGFVNSEARHHFIRSYVGSLEFASHQKMYEWYTPNWRILLLDLSNPRNVLEKINGQKVFFHLVDHSVVDHILENTIKNPLRSSYIIYRLKQSINYINSRICSRRV